MVDRLSFGPFYLASDGHALLHLHDNINCLLIRCRIDTPCCFDVHEVSPRPYPCYLSMSDLATEIGRMGCLRQQVAGARNSDNFKGAVASREYAPVLRPPIGL